MGQIWDHLDAVRVEGIQDEQGSMEAFKAISYLGNSRVMCGFSLIQVFGRHRKLMRQRNLGIWLKITDG